MNIGLFFGSFNPIHIGHLIIANTILQEVELDEIWFVVSPHNPFKKKSSLLNAYDRLHLIELAVKENDKLKTSNIELNLKQPSYTIDTLTYLWEKYPNHNFSLIMGSDNLKSFHKWKNYEVILDRAKIIVYNRQEKGLDEGNHINHPSISKLSFPYLDISATYIRSKIKAGKSVRYLLPEKSYEYIKEMNLYK